MSRFRRKICGGARSWCGGAWLAVLVAVAGTTNVSRAGSTSVHVVPLTRVHAWVKLEAVRGRDVLLLHSLEMSNIAGLSIRVSCAECRRYVGPIRVSYPGHGSKLYQGVNWLLEGGRTVTVEVYRRGDIGRYMSLGTDLGDPPTFVLSGSGCLRGPQRLTPCPRYTLVPGPDTGVLEVSPAPPTLTVEFQGSGSGIVSGHGVACTRLGSSVTGACSASYEIGTEVRLRAIPAPGSWFAGWTVTSDAARAGPGFWFAGVGSPCVIQPVCPVAMIAVDRFATATFERGRPRRLATFYDCRATSATSTNLIGPGQYRGARFVAPAGEITAGDLAIAPTANLDTSVSIGIYGDRPPKLGRRLGAVTVDAAFAGFGGVHFVFSKPIRVSRGEHLWLGVVAVGAFSAFGQLYQGRAGCLIGDLHGLA